MEVGRDVTVAEGSQYEALRWGPGGSVLSWSGPNVSADPRSNGVWAAALDGSEARQLVRGPGSR